MVFSVPVMDPKEIKRKLLKLERTDDTCIYACMCVYDCVCVCIYSYIYIYICAQNSTGPYPWKV